MTDRILIVDDELFVRQSFADFLEDCLWAPVTAESGEQALGILAETEIDAAIVDIRLGGMIGEEFIRQALPVYPDIVFIICTGSPEYIIPSDLIKSGRVSPQLFSKPVSELSKIDTELKRLLGRDERKG